VAQDQTLFRRLSRLFSSGPTIRRRVKDFSGNPTASSATDLFQRARNDIYNSVLSSYGSFDRMARYSDFAEMEATPEIASALDIYSEETVAQDEKGISLHIHSENRKIKELLETLFYDTLNTNFNLVMWTRNLCKYGDFFLFLDVSDEFGVINAYPIPISEIEREEGYDPENIGAARFRWITQGNAVLENWQVGHFRLLGNDAFLPYGTSVLESARRIWRQLILMEDAMLVYRVIRSPERRVFYIDIGNIPPENVADYMNQAKDSLKRQAIIDKNNGKVDLRYNPYSVDEDYFIPVRGGESGTKIDTLAGGTNTTAIEDVEYIQKKLFSALKIPKAYLGYDEDIGAKATLAQEDIRFSRTIQRIQQTIISELNKIAMIHLYSHGFDGEDLIDFELKLSNPSSIAQQQKLELISTRFDIAGKAPEGVVDRYWVRKNVMNLTDYEIEKIEQGRIDDKLEDAEIESAGVEDDAGGMGGEDLGGGEDLFAADIPDENASLLIDMPVSLKGELDEIDEDDDEDDEDDALDISIDDKKSPVKTSNQPKNVFGGKLQKSRKKTGGPLKSSMPNMMSMVSVGSATRSRDTSNKPYDNDFVIKFNESPSPALTPEITRTLRDMGISRNTGTLSGILLETSIDHIDIEIDDDESDE
jgi:hypothetical protein